MFHYNWAVGEYSKIAVVFSGRRSFHIHVLDFNIRDWTSYNERKPIKSQSNQM